MLLFIWVWMEGGGGWGVGVGGSKVAVVIVGLSSAVKTPPGKIRIHQCVVTAVQEPQ